MKNKKGVLIVLSGPSGCGKGTVLKELISKNSNVFLSISATTRNPRDGEIDGKNYYFISKDEFEKQIQNDGMLEYAKYCENFYGTPKAPVLKRLENGQNVILEIEVQGAMKIKEKQKDAILVFLMPPSMEELERRLVDRKTDDIKTITKRLNIAKEEISNKDKYDYIIINNTVLEAVDDLQSIIKAERIRNK